VLATGQEKTEVPIADETTVGLEHVAKLNNAREDAFAQAASLRN